MSVRRPGATGLLLVLLSGCKGCESETTLPALLEAEDATPVGVWVSEALGAGSASVPLFAVNALGAPVPSGEIALATGATAPIGVTPGLDGWAVADLSGAPGRYALEASVDGLVGVSDVWLTAARSGLIDAPAAPLPAAPSAIARAGGGVAAAVGGEVWWTALDGRQPVRVLSLPDPIAEIASVEIDADGVTDLLVTSSSHLVALRGRDDGGLAWGAGWAGTGPVIGGAVGDFDGDNLADLVAAVEVDGAASVLVLQGDGAWSFDPKDALAPGYAAFDLSLDDLDRDGVGELTLLTDAGLLRRYTKLDGSWTATLTGTQYELDIGAGGRLLPSADVSGDGVADLVAVGPTLAGDIWHGWVVTAGADAPARYEVAAADNGFAWGALALGDLSGDGAADIAYVAPDRLARVTWAAASENFEVQFWTDAPTSPAVTVADVDGDGVNDVVVGDAAGVRAYRGEREEDDLATAEVDESTIWRPATPDVSAFGLDLLLPPALGDRSGDGVVDVVGVIAATDLGGVAVEGLLGIAATDVTEETLRVAATLDVSGSGVALDVAAGDGAVYVLYTEADESGAARTRLAIVEVSAALVPTLATVVDVDGERLVGGAFANGPVAVLDGAGGVVYVAADGLVTPGESGPAYAAAVAWDPDGDGVDELLGCEEEGCRVAAADVDGDGAPERLLQTSTGTSVWFGETELLVDALGAAGLADTDGDGVAEVVVGENGLVRAFHGVAGALSPAWTSWTWRPVQDAVQFGDLDGDGLPDVFFVGEDRYPDSPEGDSWVGTLVYANAE